MNNTHTTTTTTMPNTNTSFVREDMPDILAAIRDASRYSSDHFDRNYVPAVDAALKGLRPDRWIGVACLPLVSVKDLIIRREAVHEAEFGIGSGTTNSGRTLFGAIDTAATHCCGWERDEDTDPQNQAGLAHNRAIGANDTWLVVSMEKDPRISAFTTDLGEFGRVQWTVFAPQPEGTALQAGKIVWCQASAAQMMAAERD